MGLPRKLKDFNLFSERGSFVGEVSEISLPKLSRKMEEYRAAGMSGPVKVDFGFEAIEMEWTIGGWSLAALRDFGVSTHNGVQLRFTGACQNEDTGEISAVEIIVRGRHSEIDMGTAKAGEDTEHKFTTACSYYKLVLDNEILYEFDFVNGIEIIDGKDQRADIRSALGI